MKFKKKINQEIIWANKEAGLLTPIIMIFFRILQYFPLQILWGNRTDYFFKINNSEVDFEKSTRKRAIRIDIITISFLLVEILYPILLINLKISYSLSIILLIFIILRYIDIIQVNVNILLFDQIRIGKVNTAASSTRLILLLIINYLEFILIFGFIYLNFHENIKNISNWYDAYYFSTITQLTIGYGDLYPVGYLRIISTIQGITGTFFIAIMVAQIVTLLPKLKTMNNKNDEKE